jgi:NTP pyrophosphatase (non-canonical NTP hydrolase)
MLSKETLELIKLRQVVRGREFTLYCAIEEMSELTKEILKNINRGQNNVPHILEELADVLVGVEYVKMAYGFSDAQVEKSLTDKINERSMPKLEEWRRIAAQKQNGIAVR